MADRRIGRRSGLSVFGLVAGEELQEQLGEGVDRLALVVGVQWHVLGWQHDQGGRTGTLGTALIRAAGWAVRRAAA